MVQPQFVVKEPFVNVHVLLTIGIPSHNIIITKLIPLNLGGDPSKPIGVIVTFVQPITHYYKRRFNYQRKTLIQMVMYGYSKLLSKLR
jgi:hypothetical protein